jgi:hypothetical protein
MELSIRYPNCFYSKRRWVDALRLSKLFLYARRKFGHTPCSYKADMHCSYCCPELQAWDVNSCWLVILTFRLADEGACILERCSSCIWQLGFEAGRMTSWSHARSYESEESKAIKRHMWLGSLNLFGTEFVNHLRFGSETLLVYHGQIYQIYCNKIYLVWSPADRVSMVLCI